MIHTILIEAPDDYADPSRLEQSITELLEADGVLRVIEYHRERMTTDPSDVDPDYGP